MKWEESLLNRRELVSAVLAVPVVGLANLIHAPKPIIVNLGRYHDPPLHRLFPSSDDTLYFCEIPELPGYFGVVNHTHGIIRINGVPAEPGETLAAPEWMPFSHIEWPSRAKSP